MSRRAIICGGSVGGLFAAAALQRTGWEVDVLERSDVELAGRGAGIVTHDELIGALQLVGAGIEDLGVEVNERTAFDINGGVVASLDYHQIVTSWDRIHQLLRAVIPDAHHHLGSAVTAYEQINDEVIVTLDNGTTRKGDILIGADGFRSSVRAQMLPDIVPIYSGYVVYRALVKEADLSPELRKNVFGKFGMFVADGGQIIGYPIAGSGNDLRENHRRYNFVWYTPIAQDVLDDMLTDSSGKHHAISIPPPLVRDDVLERMTKLAHKTLPKPFLEMLACSERPFFTPIYDHHSPVFADGRVALSGDAACVARPHVGMGITKAACDALALARHLENEPDACIALKNYSDERMPAARAAFEQSRKLGALTFSSGSTEPNLDGRSNPHLSELMSMTARADF